MFCPRLSLPRFVCGPLPFSLVLVQAPVTARSRIGGLDKVGLGTYDDLVP
jgi:hypothetical protein